MSRASIQAGKAVIVVDIVNKATANFNKMVQSLKNAARGLQTVGQNALGGALFTGLATGKLTNNFIKFDDAIKNLAAKLGFLGTISREQTADLDMLKESILELGKVSSFTALEVANAAVELAAAGFKPMEVKASLKATLDMARGTGYAVKDTAIVLSNAVKTFGLFDESLTFDKKLDNITLAASQMVKATRMGTVEVSDLAESLKMVSGSATMVGATIPTVLGFLVEMGDSGLKASLGGTTMNTMLNNLVTNLKKVKEVFPAYNLVMSADGMKLNLSESIAQLQSFTKNLNIVDKLTITRDIFNMRGSRAFSASGDIEKIIDNIKALENAGQEAALAGAMMNSGLGGAFRRLIGSLDVFGLRLGYLINDPMTSFINILTQVINMLEKMSNKFKLAVIGLILSPVVFTSLAVAALSLSFVLAKLATALTLVGFAGSKLKSLGGLLGSSLTNTAKLVTSPNAGTKAYKAQALKISKGQLAIDKMLVVANAKAAGTARTNALAKVASSAKMKSLISNSFKLKEMKAKSLSGTLKTDAIIAGKTVGGAFQRGFSLSAIKGIGGKTIIGEFFKGGSIGKTFATLGEGVSIIARLAFSFGRLTFSVTRFIFSWNFVGLVLNGLLLFGHKIPAITNAFKALGQGFSDAFGQLAKIAQYAAPAIDLLKIAFEAFLNNETAIGMSALQSGFQGIVDIINNQLIAAWNSFMLRVDYLWANLKNIGSTLGLIVESLVSGVASIGANTLEGIGNRLPGGDAANPMELIKLIGLTLNNFLTDFAILIIKMEDWIGKFVGKVDDLTTVRGWDKALLNVVKAPILGLREGIKALVPKSSVLGETLRNTEDPAIEGIKTVNEKIAALQEERLKREKAHLEGWDEINAKAIKAREDAIADLAFNAIKLNLRLEREAKNTANNLAASILANKPPVVPPDVPGAKSPPGEVGGAGAVLEQFISKMSVLIGGAAETRNIYRVDSKSTLQEMKSQTDILKGIEKGVKGLEGAF